MPQDNIPLYIIIALVIIGFVFVGTLFNWVMCKLPSPKTGYRRIHCQWFDFFGGRFLPVFFIGLLASSIVLGLALLWADYS